MIVKYDTSFSLSFPVGKKYVIGQFHLKVGEEVSSAVDQFMNEFDIPCYFRISLLNTIESLIKQDKILTKDNDDINNIIEISNLVEQQQQQHVSNSGSGSDIIMDQQQHIIDQLSNQFTEKIQYWNKFINSKENIELLQQEERISTFLYLVDKNSDTRERIINQEELFATETSILLVKKQDDLKQLNEKHSQEMEDAFRNSLLPDQVELIVANNMQQVDEFDSYYNNEITILKQKQKQEFTKFLNDLYWLEKTKDDLDEIESFNNSNQSTTVTPTTTTTTSPPSLQSQQTQSQTQLNTGTNNNNNGSGGGIMDSIGQNLDKGVARASSFFSFGFNKKNTQSTPINSPPATPQLSSDLDNNNNNNSGNNNNNNNPTKPIGINSNNKQQQQQDNNNSPPNSFSKVSSSSPIKPNLSNTTTGANTSTSNLNNLQQPRKQSTGNNTVPQPTIAILPNKNEESFTIAVGVQKKKIFNFKLIEESPLQLCRPITSLTGDYKKSKRVEYIKTLYSDSLSAVILIIDPSLQFNTENEKNFLKNCNMSTELHFESIDDQIQTFKNSLPLNSTTGKVEYLNNGDFFITKHSNLSDVQVVFHLVIDSKNRTPLGSDNQLLTTSDIAKGLRNILLTASKYGIGNITIPICLTESELDLNITNNNLLSRCVSVASVTRASLTSLQEMTSIKTVQFSLPPQLDSGNSISKGGPIAQKWKSAINPFLYLKNETNKQSK